MNTTKSFEVPIQPDTMLIVNADRHRSILTLDHNPSCNEKLLHNIVSFRRRFSELSLDSLLNHML